MLFFLQVAWSTPSVLASNGGSRRHYLPVLAPDHNGNWIAVWRSSNGFSVDLQYATLNVFLFVIFLKMEGSPRVLALQPKSILKFQLRGNARRKQLVWSKCCFQWNACNSRFFILCTSKLDLVWETDYYDSSRYSVNSWVLVMSCQDSSRLFSFQ